jgi:dTDP-4-amino-4,6-dideoxygalactose transaminase
LKEALSVFRPSIKRRDMDHVLNCMVSDNIGQGFLSSELARTLAGYLGLEGGFCCSSYHAAISLAFETLGIARGDRVIVSALAPSVYLTIMREKGCLPLFADVAPDSPEMQIESVGKLMAQNPKAIVVHHTLGFVPDMDGLLGLGLPILEDVSHAVGAGIGDRKAGGWGQLTVLSLGPRGIITCGMGGAILSRDRGLLKEVRNLDPENNHILADLNASLGLAQMRELESFLTARRRIERVFSESLMRSRHRPLIAREESESVPYSFPVFLTGGMREIRRYAGRKRIDTRPAFVDSSAAENDSCLNARNLTLRCLLFPLYPMLGKRNVEHIARVIATLP